MRAQAQAAELISSGFVIAGGLTAANAGSSPISGAAATQISAGGTSPPGGAIGADGPSSPVPQGDAALTAGAAGSPTTSTSGTLGARGPPATYGPVLISAASGGSLSAGAATLTFAPGSLPGDAYVSVTVTAAQVNGLTALSPAYDLTAVDTITGATIEHFNVPPVLSIASSSIGAIYYLNPAGGAQPITSSYDAATGTVSAALPHFSTYVLSGTTWTITLDNTGSHTVSLDESSTTFTVTDNGTPNTEPVAAVTQIVIDGGTQNDSLTLTSTNPLSVPLTFDGGAGNDSLIAPNYKNAWSITGLNWGSSPPGWFPDHVHERREPDRGDAGRVIHLLARRRRLRLDHRFRWRRRHLAR